MGLQRPASGRWRRDDVGAEAGPVDWTQQPRAVRGRASPALRADDPGRRGHELPGERGSGGRSHGARWGILRRVDQRPPVHHRSCGASRPQLVHRHLPPGVAEPRRLLVELLVVGRRVRDGVGSRGAGPVSYERSRRCRSGGVVRCSDRRRRRGAVFGRGAARGVPDRFGPVCDPHRREPRSSRRLGRRCRSCRAMAARAPTPRRLLGALGPDAGPGAIGPRSVSRAGADPA